MADGTPDQAANRAIVFHDKNGHIFDVLPSASAGVTRLRAGPLFALYSTLITTQNARNASDRTGRLRGSAQMHV